MSDPETESPAAPPIRESEEDDVASHVGRENMAERQKTYRVHHSGHSFHA